jgi:hypothetical protein
MNKTLQTGYTLPFWQVKKPIEKRQTLKKHSIVKIG